MTVSHRLLPFIVIIVTLFFMMILQPLASYACTQQRVLEARSDLSRSALSHPVLPEFHPQGLTTNQLCLVEAFFLRYARGPIEDLQGVLRMILRWNNISDLQAEIVQSLIEKASPSNDIHEATMIQNVMYQFERHLYDDFSQTPPQQRTEYRRLYFSPTTVALAQSVIEIASSSNDIHEARMIYNILSGYRQWNSYHYSSFSREYIGRLERRPFHLSPEKAELIDFILKRATDDNYFIGIIIYLILERDLSEQDLRNIKLAILAAGRDFPGRGNSFLESSLYFYGFSPISVMRAMTDPNTSHQMKDLMALVIALEHPENEIAEGPLLSRIVNLRHRYLSQEEYQCTVNALHTYMSPDQEDRPLRITDHHLLRSMIGLFGCLGNPYFDRSDFINYDIEETLNEALLTLEAEEDINTNSQ